MAKLLFPILFLSLFLTGCGKDDLQGDVTAKQVKAGYDFVYMQPIYTSQCSGQPVSCRQVMTGTIPIWYHVPTCYEISVAGEKSGNTCVDESRWAELEVGDYYEGPDVDPKDRKEKK